MATKSATSRKPAPETSGEISVEMTFKKETPGTFVFHDETEDTLIPSLYIRKAAFGATPPKTITVTVK